MAVNLRTAPAYCLEQVWPEMDMLFFSSIGLVFFLYTIYRLILAFVKAIRLHIIKTKLHPLNFGEYSVVTGATSGIGYSIAEELAKRGSNLVIIGRKAEVLAQICSDFESKYKINVIMIVKDFIDQDYSKVKEKLEGLDIGILVNNVGVATQFGLGFEVLDEEVNICFNFEINCDSKYKHIIMCHDDKNHTFKHVEKKKRNRCQYWVDAQLLPISINWCLRIHKGKHQNIYSNSSIISPGHCKTNIHLKGSGCIFTYNLFQNHKCIHPGLVATKMSKVSPHWYAPSPQSYAASAVDTFPYTGESNGCLLHFIMTTSFKLVPSLLFDMFYSLAPPMKFKLSSREKKD
ncbi:Estradiol 17-beta-dehydrogenase 12 [Thelohanellus kitauei]|uniref:Estradiol 17-beta-dehydrogenase 12 n=1 Tax=Thelohanellus kitauei TaxID=669202 RepID=A0A0C2MZV7_THEKT|nr:Estradiol 17-beta-dehydrogenase 12 [Thelohanellus kitauei]